MAARSARARQRRRSEQPPSPTTTSSRSCSTHSMTGAWSTNPSASRPGPTWRGRASPGTGSVDARDVRLTMRDVVLMHVEDGLSAVDEDQKVFAANLEFDLLGREIRFDRGYQWVDVQGRRQAVPLRQLALRGVQLRPRPRPGPTAPSPSAGGGPDDDLRVRLQLRPLNNTTKPHDHVPHLAAYEEIIGERVSPTSGWSGRRPRRAGPRACQRPSTTPTAPGFDHRIDMIFARTAMAIRSSSTAAVSPVPPSTPRTPSTGLWPSDHGGVVLRLRGL